MLFIFIYFPHFVSLADVKIDDRALPTNVRNNNNNNLNNNNNGDDNNEDDVSDVTSLSTPAKANRERSGAVERKYGQISHHIYLLYMRASGLPIIIVFFITALIWQFLRVYTDIWLQHWSDHVHQRQHQQQELQQRETEWRWDWNRDAAITTATTTTTATDADADADSDEVTYYFRMYATISCVCIIMAMISTPAGQWAGCNACRNLHDKLLQTILHKTLHFFQVTPLGRIVNCFSNDMAIIDKVRFVMAPDLLHKKPCQRGYGKLWVLYVCRRYDIVIFFWWSSSEISEMGSTSVMKFGLKTLRVSSKHKVLPAMRYDAFRMR